MKAAAASKGIEVGPSVRLQRAFFEEQPYLFLPEAPQPAVSPAPTPLRDKRSEIAALRLKNSIMKESFPPVDKVGGAKSYHHFQTFCPMIHSTDFNENIFI